MKRTTVNFNFQFIFSISLLLSFLTSNYKITVFSCSCPALFHTTATECTLTNRLLTELLIMMFISGR